MPVVGAPALAVDGEHVRGAVDGGHRRVGGGEVAEVAGEGLLALVVEVHVVEGQGLVDVEGLADRGDLFLVERLGDVYAGARAPMCAVTLLISMDMRGRPFRPWRVRE